MARHGCDGDKESWHGGAWLGLAVRGAEIMAWLGDARQVQAWESWLGMARRGLARTWEFRSGLAVQDTALTGGAWQG